MLLISSIQLKAALHPSPAPGPQHSQGSGPKHSWRHALHNLLLMLLFLR
jgi:hypothetical protein